MWSNLMIVSCELAGESSNSHLVPKFIFFGAATRPLASITNNLKALD